MIRLIAPLLLLTISLSASASGSSKWPDAYSRRDYKLGMSLAEFRNTQHPDQVEWPNAYPVCTNEARGSTYPYSSSLYISADWKSAGVIKCAFFYDSKSMSSATTAGLILGGVSSLTEFFFIPASPNEEPQLFYISSGGPTANYDDLVLTFTEALGKPISVKLEKLQNRMGAEFDNTITTWSNKSSKVVANRYGETIRVFEVRHILTPLWSVFETNLGKGRTDKAKKL